MVLGTVYSHPTASVEVMLPVHVAAVHAHLFGGSGRRTSPAHSDLIFTFSAIHSQIQILNQMT